MLSYFVVFWLFLAASCCVYGQDCLLPSDKCGDSEQCCGGCCVDGQCTETYDDCILVEYPCIDEYCPPGFECYMYKPSSACVGCGLQRACRPFTTPQSPDAAQKNN